MKRVGRVEIAWGATDRPVARWGEDVVSVLISIVGVAGMYWDAWRHNTEAIEDDNFWSAPHIALYAALTILALWIGGIILRRQPRTRVDLSAIPRGYGIGVVGLALASVGGVGDFIWHAAFGFEDQANAFWSPPHQLLFYGAVLLTSAPLISSWHRGGGRLDARAAVPVVLATAAMMGAATYAVMHISPLWNNVALTDDFQAGLAQFNDAYPSGTDLPPGQVGLDTAVRTFGGESFPYYFYSLNKSVASIFLLSLTLAAPVLLLVRRWRPPPGAIAAIFGLYGVVYAIPTEFRDVEYVIALVVAGLLVDGVIAWLRPEEPDRPWQFRALGAAVPLLSISSYLVAVQLGAGLAWSVSVWLGVLVTSTMLGLALASLMAPPRITTA